MTSAMVAKTVIPCVDCVQGQNYVKHPLVVTIILQGQGRLYLVLLYSPFQQ